MITKWLFTAILVTVSVTVKGDQDGIFIFAKNFPTVSFGLDGWEAKTKINGDPFILRSPGLTGDANSVSFESANNPGSFLRHFNFLLFLEDKHDSPRNEVIFDEDATFKIACDKWFDGFVAFESVNFPNHYIRHQSSRLKISDFADNDLFKNDASWKLPDDTYAAFCSHCQSGISIVSQNFPSRSFGLDGWEAKIKEDGDLFILKSPGLSGDAGSISFESAENPGSFLRHFGFFLFLEDIDNNPRNPDIFDVDATFKVVCNNKWHSGFIAFESVNFPNHFVRHQNSRLRISEFEDTQLFKDDASFAVPDNIFTALCGKGKPGCQTCCCGALYGDKSSPCRDRDFHCCGTCKYNPATTTCCQGVLKEGYPEHRTKCCGTEAYDPNSYTCCERGCIVPASRNQDQCCGFEAFNQKHEICCDGVPQKRHNYHRCCGFDLFNTVTEICCDGAIGTDKTPTTRCCGTLAYDQCIASCCSDGTISPNPSSEFGNSDTLACGDSGTWVPQSEVCCCGTVVSQPTTATTGCCDTTPYNVETQICCDGSIITEDPEKFQCCGTSAYKSYHQTCCNGNIVVGSLDCCNDQGFNPMTEICCRGQVFPGCPSRTKCCYSYDDESVAAYDSKKQLCCNGIVRDGNKKYRCCGNQAYLPKKESCCYGKVVIRWDYRGTGICAVPT